MAKAKRNTAEQNVSAAYDRNMAAAHTLGEDTKILYQRITELEAELDDYREETQVKLNEIVKEYDQKVSKLTTQNANMEAKLAKYEDVFRGVTGTIGSIKT